MRQLIEEGQMDLGLPDVETIGQDRKMPDTVIYESPRSQNVLCLIEAELPPFDVFDEGLKEDARKKAVKRRAKYFATTNFRQLVWWNTAAVNAGEREERQLVHRYDLSQIEDLDDLDQTRFREPTRRALARFLARLAAVHSGRELEPRLPIDELLVYRLHERVRVLARHYKGIIADRCHKDASFRDELRRWFGEQSWEFRWQESDYDKAARQAAYLLVNKILFYNLLQAKRPLELAPLNVPEGLTARVGRASQSAKCKYQESKCPEDGKQQDPDDLGTEARDGNIVAQTTILHPCSTKGAQLQKILQIYFDEVLKIDYETIFTTDFIDEVAFPDEEEVVREVETLVRLLKRYDFSALGYDVVGRIFEQLIPTDERHNLGQYFTRSDVVDLILRFCLKKETDVVLDPACGAGTFLVRAYYHKKLMNRRLAHEALLETLWGDDIAKFPAHLATINLAVLDLASDKNYPNIIREDFFALPVGNAGFELPTTVRRRRAVILGAKERQVTHPRWFDAIVGNPPYTRQEEMKHIADKGKTIASALTSGTRALADISARASIHAYFFVHGTKFLKDGGRFGFIVSNSWMDVDYGKGLQQFFLDNYKIVAIIESKVERWFEDADVNTCIVILEKCQDKVARESNLVRFVYLKRPLRYFIPSAEDAWETQRARVEAIDKLIQTALFHTTPYENDDLRIFPKKQAELRQEGLDPEKQEYVGAKWGKYLRAPEVFFRIMEKCKDKLVPLRELAQVRRGFTTGANSFFYLTEDEIRRRGIEREFWMHKDDQGRWVPNYVVKSPKECRTLVVDPRDLKFRVLMIHRDRDHLMGTQVLRYIASAERKGLHKRSTMSARGERWYDLGEREPADGLWRYVIGDRYSAFLNHEARAYADCELFDVRVHRRADRSYVMATLNSTLTMLFSEAGGRTNLGLGALKTQVYEVERTPIPNPAIAGDARTPASRALGGMKHRAIGSVFEELGAKDAVEVALDKVKSDRRELDRIVMGEILGLTNDEQLEVYRAVVDMVRARIDRAKSVEKVRRTPDGLDLDLMKGTILQHVVREP